MATKDTATTPGLPSEDVVKLYRETLLRDRVPAAPGTAEERVQRAKAAMSGLRLGGPVTPSHYR